jgi:hypothetical protein
MPIAAPRGFFAALENDRSRLTGTTVDGSCGRDDKSFRKRSVCGVLLITRVIRM